MQKEEYSILQTLAYFDIFNRPLTKEELSKYLWQSFLNNPELLTKMAEEKKIGNRDGYYFLPGRDETTVQYQANVWLVEKKMKIARRAAQKLRYIPFVQAMFVCNTVAMGSPKESSDVDVFIVVRAGRLWLTRLLVTVLLSIFRLRRTKTRVADRVCLSFYHVDEALSFQPLSMFPDDIYLAYWIAQLIPIYDSANVQAKIMKENTWVRTFIPNALETKQLISRWGVPGTSVSWLFKKLFEAVFLGRFGNLAERICKKAQTWKMRKNKISLQNEPDTRVVISDTMLKFHENDRRAMYRERWLRTCEELKN